MALIESSSSSLPGAAPRRLPGFRFGVVLAGAVAALFALLAVEYAFALAAGRPSGMVRLLAWLTRPDFAYGPRATTAYMVPAYTEGLGRVGPHMVLGSLALGLGMLQLVPALRRRQPRLHRASGMVVWLATLASMVGAIGFLVFIPMKSAGSGPAFHLGLWALALLNLFLLAQAVLAIRERDYRSHMVWMSMVFAALATAPMLRVDWVLWGRFTTLTQESANLATGMLVLMQTHVLMLVWLHWVGDRDLPPRAQARPWPKWILWALCLASLPPLLHEGLLAPALWDGLAPWRAAADRPPPVAAALWALGAAAVLLHLPRAWADAEQGRPLARGLLLAGLLSAIGAVAVGLTQDTEGMARNAVATFWVGYGLMQLLMLALHPLTARAGGRPFVLVYLSLLWLPSQLPGLLLFCWWLGLEQPVAMAASLVIGVGGITVAGIVTAYGGRLHGGLIIPRHAHRPDH